MTSRSRLRELIRYARKRKSATPTPYHFYVESSGNAEKPFRSVVVRRLRGAGFPLFRTLHATEEDANASGAQLVNRLTEMMVKGPMDRQKQAEPKPETKPVTKYETESESLEAHPIFSGFRLEHALRSLATDPEFTESGRQLAKRALTTGDTSSLWPLNDELQETNHPLADKYRWLQAATDAQLDKATGAAVDAVTATPESYTPTTLRRMGIHQLRWAVAGQPTNPKAKEAVDLLRSQGHTDESLLKSLDRHAQRNGRQVLRRMGMLTNADEARLAMQPEVDDPERYRQNPALSDFIQAVRQIRSSNQEVRRQIAEQQYKKLKLNLTSLKDAISDGPVTSSADTAHTIEHNGDRERVLAAASLYGLQTNSPNLLVFHIDPTGKDSLYKFDVAGSAEKLRKRMDAAGLVNRTLLPTENGWSATVYDAGGGMEPVMKRFAQSEGVPLQHSKGVGELIGGGDEAEGEKGSRKSFRSIVRSWERKQSHAGIQQGGSANAVRYPTPNQSAGPVAAAGQPAYSTPTAAAPVAAAAGSGTIGY